MTELGLLAGDPCAADGWSSEQRIRAMAWWGARRRGAPSVTGLGGDDLRGVWRELVEAYEGLRAFLVAGLVGIRRGR
jgi:hypothetical protein